MQIELRTDRRGYTLWLERDLFGAYVLYRRWYGLHNRRGGMKRQIFLDEKTMLKTLRNILRLRERHGYVQTSG